jgi:hypothetical protein
MRVLDRGEPLIPAIQQETTERTEFQNSKMDAVNHEIHENGRTKKKTEKLGTEK